MLGCNWRRFSVPPLARHVLTGAMLAALACACPNAAGDWPTHQHDAARSGVTAEKLIAPLAHCWTLKPLFAPEPAWGDPKPDPVEGILELRRVHFDDVFQPVIAGGAAFFASSADGKVYCLDLESGRIRWAAMTGGPVRLAPTIDAGRVYVGSDDGHAYCLDAKDGAVVWRFRAAPEDRRVLGHGRMISLWPVRTGVLVDGGVAYFGAGVFPAEGVFLYAVDADSGKKLWCNDTCGEAPQSGVSPQGYLLASKTRLYAPMGRVSPAAFDRTDGKLAMMTYFGKQVGGTYALLVGEHVYTGTEEMVAYNKDTRDRFAAFDGRKIVVTEDTAYLADGKELKALDRVAYPAASRQLAAARSRRTDAAQALAALRRKPNAPKDDLAKAEKALESAAAALKEAETKLEATFRWRTPSTCADALILAGDVLVAGGESQVVALDAATGRAVWEAKVEGTAKGLAAAAGRLLASTDKGLIYCFGPKGAAQHGTVEQKPAADPAAVASSPAMREAAETILAQSGVTRGFCLVLGCETGELALELARRSELLIYAVTPDAEKAARARKLLDGAGLYGGRVCVDQWPLDKVPYSDYFANLVVSETALLTGQLPPEAEAARMLKPCGGVAMIGKKGAGTKLVRGPLPEAGSWTHLYANPANTTSSDDARVKVPLGVLWFGSPGPGQMVNRHERAAGPLAMDGRMFVQGEHTIMAYDAYNGLLLWQRDVQGARRGNASHDGSNLALSPEGLFVAVADKCLRLDPASGETAATLEMPAGADTKARRWGFLAVTGGRVYGSRATGVGLSSALFSLPIDGSPGWTYESSGQIQHTAVAIDGGKLFLVDSAVTPEESKAALEAERQRIAGLPEAERPLAEKILAKGDVRAVVALDPKTGRTLWRKPMAVPLFASGTLAAAAHQGTLVLFGVYLDGHYWQQFFAGEFAPRTVTVLSAEDGRLLWSRAVGYRVRPVIVGGELHTEPWAYDLKTGEPKTRVHPVTGREDRWQFARPGHHCGCPAAAPNALFFRSWCLGYYDLLGDQGTMHFGAQRPGCWINFIPACGLLLMPEASAGCMCAFPNMCSVAFQPVEKNKAYALYSAPGPMTPVKRLAVNFGAAGDRNDAAGDLWLSFPRPTGSLVLQFRADVAFLPGGGFTAQNSAYSPVSGTPDPWLYATAARGASRVLLPLLEEGDGTALYTVRLHLADLDQGEPGRRVFDVKLQGKVVAEGLDVAAEAGGPAKALVKEFPGVEVTDHLVVEFVPKAAKPTPDQLPILQGIEAVRDRVVSLGCSIPGFVTNSMEPKKQGEVRLTNLRETPFEGVLRLAAPQGIDASPSELPVKLAPGARMAVPVQIAVSAGLGAGKYPLSARLVRADGTDELERQATVEHLGKRGRAVLKPVEDAYVAQRYPDQNKGTATVLLVDGGDQKMGDTDHSLAFLRFKLDLPGRPISAVLRIHNAGNPTGQGGRVCLVTAPWSEKEVTYQNQPALGEEVARIGRVAEHEAIELPLKVDLSGKRELSLAIDPTSCDGVDYLSREGSKAPELVVEYEPAP